MTQEQKPEARTSSPKAALLRFSAVLTASGPVILTAFGIGRQTFAWFCAPLPPAPSPSADEFEDPHSLAGLYGLGLYAPDDLPTELLFWGVLLLPIIVAGLVMNGSRRATRTAVATIATLLAYGLVIAFLSPGPDPWTSRPHAVTPPWLLITCYPLSAAALLLTARSPRPHGRYGLILWAVAALAAGWAAMFDRPPFMYGTRISTFVYLAEASPWDGLASWFGDAYKIGLPLVLVALAAAATATAPTRWSRTAGITSAAALLLFVLVGIASYAGRDADVLELLLTRSTSWRLFLAAALVASAAWHPRPRFSWTGTVHVTRSLLRGQLENVIPTRTRNALIALLIAAGALWLIVSSFTSTR
ncbi:hypothetical protein AB0M50_07000 [Nonomuraea fuscirosea]|uniref:hypothetical protein n=1 Tax=Nonomuraea fuscirosea TaxID=1291556 RepID=UPI003431CC37